jgi:hypothetical protein
MNQLILFILVVLFYHFCFKSLKQMNDDQENKDKLAPFYLKLALVPPFGLAIEVFLVSLGTLLILHEALSEYLSKK